MGKSIKRSVTIRVAFTLVAMLLFSFITTANTFKIQGTQEQAQQASALLDRAQKAEAAHYKWAQNLSNALYAGTEFTGSTDPTGCVLGQWLYGEAGTEDPKVLELRSKLEPLHKELHESATYVLDMHKTSPSAAQAYYQETIGGNLTTLVGYLDQVVEQGTVLRDETQATMERTTVTMQITTGICLLLALGCLISLIYYVFTRAIDPIVAISKGSSVLGEGRLDIDLPYRSQNELGQLADIIRNSMATIGGYVSDINRIMGELANGNFDVSTSSDYIGDFRTIQVSVDNLTNMLSRAMGSINASEMKISGNAEQLSSSAQSLAQAAKLNDEKQIDNPYDAVITIENIGKKTAKNIVVEFQEGVGTSSNILPNYPTTGVEAGNLKPGDKKEVKLPLYVTKSASEGLKELKAKVSYEDSKGNIISTTTSVYLTIVVPEKKEQTNDILISQITQEPAAPMPGDILTVNFLVTNNGSNDVKGLQITGDAFICKYQA